MKSFLAKPALLLFLLTSTSAHSEMYKWVDEDGNTNYSDIQPFKNAGEHVSPDINTTPAVKAPKPQVTEDNSASTKETVYQFFKIASPEHDATIRNNQGNFSIGFEIQPALNTKQGHYISVLLDNKIAQDKLTSLGTQFSNIDRGTHQISALIKNKQGKTLLRTDSIRIHLRRHSILNP
jgi:Domain of unknown function (DUF4124)